MAGSSFSRDTLFSDSIASASRVEMGLTMTGAGEASISTVAKGSTQSGAKNDAIVALLLERVDMKLEEALDERMSRSNGSLD